MKIVFVSNFINHHQIPFCDACYRALGEAFAFVQTEPMTREREALGWTVRPEKIPYLYLYYEERGRCDALIEACDILLLGWSALSEELLRRSVRAGKPVLRISERIYREGQWKMISPRGLAAKYRAHYRYRRAPVYLLCAGAYVASDFRLIRSYPQKMYRWGYFPETRLYEEEALRRAKERETGAPLYILWAGRFVALKHAEYALRAANALKTRKLPFRLYLAGDGPLNGALREMARDLHLEEDTVFCGAMRPEKVRRLMEKAHIFLFTSNYLEGWGAVVNEAMNSACAMVASAEAGAVPYLLKDGVNGLIYGHGSYAEFEEGLLRLAGDDALRLRLGLAAYRTIRDAWNAETAAKRLLRFSGTLLEKGAPQAYEDGGILSPAPILKPAGLRRQLQEKNRLE